MTVSIILQGVLVIHIIFATSFNIFVFDFDYLNCFGKVFLIICIVFASNHVRDLVEWKLFLCMNKIEYD